MDNKDINNNKRHMRKEAYLEEVLHIWSKITSGQKERLVQSLQEISYKKGKILHHGASDCTGLIILISGQLRVYMLSEQGKEITLYRLFERDVCLLSASCMLHNIQFDVHIEAEKDTQAYLIPTSVYQQMMEESVVISNYTNQLISSRFSDVMWLMEQLLFKNFDSRLANFLLEQEAIDGSDTLMITQEEIAKHLGSAREVVSRMLKYFQSEQIVSLFRGGVKIEDNNKLRELVEGRQ